MQFLHSLSDIKREIIPVVDDGTWSKVVKEMTDDGLGSDFSGVRAHMALENHMRDCARREENARADRIAKDARLNSIQEGFDKRMHEMQQSFDKRMAEANISSDRRTTDMIAVLEKNMASMNNKLWNAAVGLIGVLAVIAGTLFLIIEKAK